ncbi:hypothetical protein [Arcicella aurantiaca]|nr:hypothetical protein [Arcicella aurantiaca]
MNHFEIITSALINCEDKYEAKSYLENYCYKNKILFVTLNHCWNIPQSRYGLSYDIPLTDDNPKLFFKLYHLIYKIFTKIDDDKFFEHIKKTIKIIKPMNGVLQFTDEGLFGKGWVVYEADFEKMLLD